MSQPILEIAQIYIKPGTQSAFEAAIEQAYPYLQQTEGYLDHQLRRCLEQECCYLLLVNWESLDAHLINFRQSQQFQSWRALLSPYFEQPPEVKHYQLVDVIVPQSVNSIS